MRVLYPGRTGIWKCWFLGERKNGEPGEKLSEQRENQQQTQPAYDAGPESNHGPHWWEASALTTAPFLLPAQKLIDIDGKLPIIVQSVRSENYKNRDKTRKNTKLGTNVV